MALDLDKLSPEARALAERLTRSSWDSDEDWYAKVDFDAMVDHCEPDIIAVPANHSAVRGRDAMRKWYEMRMTSGAPMNVETQVESLDIVGDLAIATGVVRLCRAPVQGSAGMDHGGRFLSIYKRGEDGEWRVWRDMDTPSPDADVFYGTVKRGW